MFAYDADSLCIAVQLSRMNKQILVLKSNHYINIMCQYKS